MERRHKCRTCAAKRHGHVSNARFRPPWRARLISIPAGDVYGYAFAGPGVIGIECVRVLDHIVNTRHDFDISRIEGFGFVLFEPGFCPLGVTP